MSGMRLVAVVLTAAGLSACAGNPETGPKENTGTLLGAVGGALIGSQIGGGPGERVAAAVAGAAIGGFLGNRIGAAMDDEDKRRAYAAEMEALETGPSGRPVEWRNPDSGRYGEVVPGPAYQDRVRHVSCRTYTHTIYINGRPEVARGTACRNPDGTWTPLA